MANMSFLPEDYLEKRIELRTNVICLALFVVVFTAVIGAYFVTNRQRTEVKQLHDEINAEFQEAANRITQLEQLQQRKQDMIRKANITRTLLEQVPRTLILSELINRMPPNLSLLNLELETKTTQVSTGKATALEEAKSKAKAKKDKESKGSSETVAVTDVLLKLVGVAPTDVEVSDYLESLGECDLLRDVSLSFSEEIKIGEKTLRKFQFGMKVQPDVDVNELEPTKVARNLKRNPMGPTVDPRELTGNPDAVPVSKGKRSR